MQNSPYLRSLPALLAPGNRVQVTVKGGCMGAALPEGETVTVLCRRVYLPGDILVFVHHSGDLYAHRFLGYVFTPWQVRLMTMADRATRSDALVGTGAVLGKVVPVAGGKVTLMHRIRAVGLYLATVCRVLLARFQAP